MPTEAYRFNHCLLTIAREAEKREATRLAYRIAWTWNIARGVHCGSGGTSLPNIVLSTL